MSCAQLHGLCLHPEGQADFDVRVEFQPAERFELRNNPARLLAGADFIGQRELLTALAVKLNGVDGIVAGGAALLDATDRNDGSDFGERKPTRRPQSQNAPARENLAVSHADSRAAESDMEESEDHQEIAQSEERGERQRNVVMHQSIHRAGENRGNNEEHQGAGGRAKGRKIKLRAAVVHRDNDFSAIRLRNRSGIGVDASRRRKTEAVRRTGET